MAGITLAVVHVLIDRLHCEPYGNNVSRVLLINGAKRLSRYSAQSARRINFALELTPSQRIGSGSHFLCLATGFTQGVYVRSVSLPITRSAIVRAARCVAPTPLPK